MSLNTTLGINLEDKPSGFKNGGEKRTK